MRGGEGDCCVVVVGAGAGGALTASHLVTGLSSRYRVALVDPSPTTGRGAAYSTTDDRHLLNVPASGMSAFPRDPEHFFRWVRTHHDPRTQPQDFVPRRVYGDYVAGLLTTASEYPGNARLERRQEAVIGIDRRGDRFVVRLETGQSIVARAVVLATGSRPGTDWAPATLATSSRLVADPWTQALPEGDLLLVGTGLTMVDVAIAADRPGRTTAHGLAARPRAPGAPTADDPRRPSPARDHPAWAPSKSCAMRSTLTSPARFEETGDWRAAVDGLRPVTAQLWQGLGEEDRQAFLADARADLGRAPPPDASRHRGPARGHPSLRPPGPAHRARWSTPVRSPRASRSPSPTVSRCVVGGVVNCTGPVGALAADPLLSALARTGLVRPGPAGLGIDTADDGRVLGVLPAAMPLYAMGSLRRGNLWETTAMPEIREQAYDVARAVVRALHGETQAPTGRHLRAHPDHRTPGGRGLQRGARPAAPTAGRRRGRAGGRGRRGPALHPGPRRPGPAGARVGRDRDRGAAPSMPHTPLPPSGTSTTGRPASSMPSPPASAPTRRPARLPCCATSGCSRATRWRSAWPCRRSPSADSPPGSRRPTWSRDSGAPTATTGGTPASWPSSARTRSAGARPRTWRRTPSPWSPSSGHAVHARAHVFYETGEHVAGLGLARRVDPHPRARRPTTARTSPGTPRSTS